jgi:hypothetical protein
MSSDVVLITAAITHKLQLKDLLTSSYRALGALVGQMAAGLELKPTVYTQLTNGVGVIGREMSGLWIRLVIFDQSGIDSDDSSRLTTATERSSSRLKV